MKTGEAISLRYLLSGNLSPHWHPILSHPVSLAVTARSTLPIQSAISSLKWTAFLMLCPETWAVTITAEAVMSVMRVMSDCVCVYLPAAVLGLQVSGSAEEKGETH